MDSEETKSKTKNAEDSYKSWEQTNKMAKCDFR